MFTALKGGLLFMSRKEKDVAPIEYTQDSPDVLQATHIWYGPHSPFLKQKKKEECQYRYIFFPTKI